MGKIDENTKITCTLHQMSDAIVKTMESKNIQAITKESPAIFMLLMLFGADLTKNLIKITEENENGNKESSN